MKDENSTKINEKNYESPESNTSTKDLQTVELNKHKQIPSCLNNCINWKLRAKMNNDKKNENIDIKEYEFNGKSLFFKKLNASILNILQNNNSNSGAGNNNFNNNNCLNQMEKESKNQLSLKLKFPSSPSSIRDILNINFPIDNSEFNFMIIDANLGVSENLNNIFFLEFDLTNGDNNNNLDLRSLNDECVEKEINFVLNGTLHDIPLFKSDLLFSVEYRKFIKSIQFRLQSYKNNTFDNKKRNNWKRKKMNSDKNNQMTFFAKILSNINIGIEFTRPFLGEYEVFHTNFNSVVNSDIKINKIYLELCIPKMFINNNINLSSVLNKEIEKIEKENNETKTNETNSNTNNNTNENNNNFLLSSPTITYQNDFDRMLSNQHNSPPSIRNKFTLGKIMKYNNFYSPNYMNSPNFINNNNSPNSFNPQNYINNNSPNSYNPNYINNNSGISSPIIYTPLSPMMQNPYLLNLGNPINLNNNNNNNNNNSNGNPRKFSENIYEKLKENPLSKMNRPIYNNSQTPIIMKINNDDMIRSIPIQPFFSPRGKGNIDNNSNTNNNNINGNFYSMTPMIQTIHERILDWEKKYTNVNNINDINNNEKNELSNINSCNPQQNLINMKKLILNCFEGKTNLDIFINSITPFIQKENIENYFQLKLMNHFNYFKYISLFQLKNTYYLYSDLIFIYYSVTLASMNIVITKKDIIDKLTYFLISNKKIKSKEEIKDNEDIIINEMNITLIIRYNSDKIYISFYENKPWHSRLIFIQQINEIMKIIPILKEISIEEIDIDESYYSILYYPTKANKPYMTFTSFLVFYKFKKEDDKNNNEKYEKNSLMGILPIKFDTKLFLTKISNNNFITIPIPPFSPFFPNYSVDTLNLRNLINGVMDNLKNTRHTSFDYDYYMKTSNFNYK